MYQTIAPCTMATLGLYHPTATPVARSARTSGAAVPLRRVAAAAVAARPLPLPALLPALDFGTRAAAPEPSRPRVPRSILEVGNGQTVGYGAQLAADHPVRPRACASLGGARDFPRLPARPIPQQRAPCGPP